MAVRRVTEWAQDVSSQGATSNATASLSWTVVVDKGDLPHVAEGGIPYAYGASMQGDPHNRVCIGKRAQLEPDSGGAEWVYRVTADFSAAVGDVVLNPLERVFRPRMTFEDSREPISIDENGDAILASVGTAFDPPYEENFSDPVLEFTNNVSTFRAVIAALYRNAVNSDGFLGFAPGELKITGFDINPTSESGVEYYQEIVRMTARPNNDLKRPAGVLGWASLILDESKYERRLSRVALGNLVPTPIVDGQGQPVSDPQKLDGGGTSINITKQANPIGPKFVASRDGQSAFRVVNPRVQRAFSALQLRYKI